VNGGRLGDIGLKTSLFFFSLLTRAFLHVRRFARTLHRATWHWRYHRAGMAQFSLVESGAT
jgi:hypothetical protein